MRVMASTILAIFIVFVLGVAHAAQGAGKKKDDGSVELTITLSPDEQKEILEQEKTPETNTDDLLSGEKKKDPNLSAQGLKLPKINLGRKTGYCCVCTSTTEHKAFRAYGDAAAQLRCFNECGQYSLKKGLCE